MSNKRLSALTATMAHCVFTWSAVTSVPDVICAKRQQQLQTDFGYNMNVLDVTSEAWWGIIFGRSWLQLHKESWL